MPVTVKKLKNKYRVVEAETGKISRTDKGNARDGGGHVSKKRADMQARAINANMHGG